MAYIATWNGHTFRIDPTMIYSFTGLTMKGSSETEDKDSKNQKYVNRKNGKPYEISFTIELDQRLGVKNVREESMSYCSEARSGASDFFYFGGKKAWKCKFMLTDADVQNVEILPDGSWLLSEVKCTWKQCEKDEEESEKKDSNHRGGSGKKKSAKKTSAKIDKDEVDAVSGPAPKVNSNTKSTDYIAKKVAAARKAIQTKNAAKKTTTTTTVKKKMTGYQR